MPVIYLIGDSTVQSSAPPFRGWGWALEQYTAPGIRVENHGLSGSSTKSFMDAGLFAPVEEKLAPDDVLMMQFGHNDEKDQSDLHTEPWGSYQENLTRYAEAAERRGALPVLLTSVSRRIYVGGGSLLYTHGEYPAAVKELAARRGWPVIDLEGLSRQLYLSLGEEGTAELFVRLAPGENPDFPDGHNDLTHFNADGAARIAALVAGGMAEDQRLRPYVKG